MYLVGCMCFASDWGVRMFDVLEEKEVKADSIPFEIEDGRPLHVHFAPDGSILSVGTRNGEQIMLGDLHLVLDNQGFTHCSLRFPFPGIVHNFLARLPALYASYGTRVAYLSSLREVSVVDGTSSRRPDMVSVSLEPAFLALGPYHLAAGINSHVVYYNCKDSSMIGQQEYLGAVSELRLNDKYAAVLSEGQITLHFIESAAGKVQRKTFPGETSRYITCRNYGILMALGMDSDTYDDGAVLAL